MDNRAMCRYFSKYFWKLSLKKCDKTMINMTITPPPSPQKKKTQPNGNKYDLE